MPVMLAVANRLDILTLVAHACKMFYAIQGILMYKKVINRVLSAKVICRFDRLRTSCRKSQRAI